MSFSAKAEAAEALRNDSDSLRFNQPVAAEEIARFGQALGSDDPPAKVEELAPIGGFEQLRDLGIPEEAPAEVAEFRRRSSRRQGESAPGHSDRRRVAAALDLVIALEISAANAAH